MLDQRATKQGKQPDYTCSNPNCLNEKGYRTGVWLKSSKAQAPVTGYAQQMAPKQPLTERPAQLTPEPPMPWEGSIKDEQLIKLYWACVDDVLAGIAARKLADYFKPENVASMASTLYIARSRIL